MGDVEQSAGMVVPGWGRKVGPREAPWGLEVQAPLQKQNQKLLSTPLPDVFGVRKAPLSAQAPGLSPWGGGQDSSGWCDRGQDTASGLLLR